MAQETDYQLVLGGQGPLIRTIAVTTLINGVPTTVNMEVIALSDANGNVLFPPTDRQDEILSVLKDIRAHLALLLTETGTMNEIADDMRADAESEDLS